MKRICFALFLISIFANVLIASNCYFSGSYIISSSRQFSCSNLPNSINLEFSVYSTNSDSFTVSVSGCGIQTTYCSKTSSKCTRSLSTSCPSSSLTITVENNNLWYDANIAVIISVTPSCNSYSSCSSCTSNSCIWCNNESTCASVASCSSGTRTCSSTSCGSYSSCSSCTQKSGCIWCGSSSYCANSGVSCSGSTTTCNACNNITSCSDCNSNSNCKYCNGALNCQSNSNYFCTVTNGRSTSSCSDTIIQSVAGQWYQISCTGCNTCNSYDPSYTVTQSDMYFTILNSNSLTVGNGVVDGNGNAVFTTGLFCSGKLSSSFDSISFNCLDTCILSYQIGDLNNDAATLSGTAIALISCGSIVFVVIIIVVAVIVKKRTTKRKNNDNYTALIENNKS